MHSGANLSECRQGRAKKLNEEESTLTHSLHEQAAGRHQGGGICNPGQERARRIVRCANCGRRPGREGSQVEGYVLPLQNTTQQPELDSLSRPRDSPDPVREFLEPRRTGRANDTRETVARLAQLRAQKAKLLGFPNYAAWKLEDQMAKTPDAALKFMDALVPAATARAAGEAQEIQAVIDSTRAARSGFKLEPWDWNYYAEQVRKAKYDHRRGADQAIFRAEQRAENGVFYAANQLYGITFKERNDIPVYNPDVRVFEVFDADGQPLALFYCDYFKRDNKNGGAWMSNFVDQSKLLGTQAGGLQRLQLHQAGAGRARACSASTT